MFFKRAPTRKTDLINHLGKTRNYRTYLEICTSVTGGRYAEIDRSIFGLSHRLMYRCPGTFGDGLGIDFRSETSDISACIDAIEARNLLYDVILVDGWHEYYVAYRDLALAGARVAKHGTIVVHDCLPPDESIAAPQYSSGSSAWCGVTYKAFLDFVSSRSDLSYVTVNTDYGCGIVRRSCESGPGFAANRSIGPDTRATLLRRWRSLGEDGDFGALYRFFKENSEALLNLVNVDAFKRSEARQLA